jgi:hypothetical protein
MVFELSRCVDPSTLPIPIVFEIIALQHTIACSFVKSVAWGWFQMKSLKAVNFERHYIFLDTVYDVTRVSSGLL